MSPMLMFASLAITGALILYTIGVLKERADGRLRGIHLAFFWCGLACDTTGTTLMSIIARESAATAPAIHGITGLAAIVLMLFHAIWATVVYVQGRGHNASALKREQTFHRLSAAVWIAWLVPHVIGLLVGIPFIKLGTTPSVILSVLVAGVAACLVFRPHSSRA